MFFRAYYFAYLLLLLFYFLYVLKHILFLKENGLATTKNSEVLFPALQQVFVVTLVELINLCKKNEDSEQYLPVIGKTS